jgi:hypothetical protein
MSKSDFKIYDLTVLVETKEKLPCPTYQRVAVSCAGHHS